MDRRNQGQDGGGWTSQTAINCGCSHLTHLIVLWQKKKSCATKTFLLWFTLYLAVSKALEGWYSIGRFNGGFLFFALRVYGAYIWVTYFRNFTVWRSNENSTCNILSRITSEPQGQTLRSRRRNYVRIRDRWMLMRWLWRSWFWPWFLCATPTLGSKKRTKSRRQGNYLLDRSIRLQTES